MKTGVCPAAAAIAALLWTGFAIADEPAGSEDLFALDAGAVETLSADELSAASGGQSLSWTDVTQTSGSSQGFEFSGNDFAAGEQIKTGSSLSLVGNSGGINNVMTNSGNNVSFQNSTILNIHLGAGASAGAP